MDEIKEEVVEEVEETEEEIKVYKIKKFKFRDIQIMAEFLARMELTPADLKEMYESVAAKPGSKMTNLGDIEKYVSETEGEERFAELMEEYAGKTDSLIRYVAAKQSAESGRMQAILVLVYKVIELVGTKFDVFADLILHLIVNIDREELEDMDAEDAVALIKRLATSGEVKSFFTAISR